MKIKNAWNSFRELISNNKQQVFSEPDVQQKLDAANQKSETNENGEVQNLKNQLKTLEAKNSKLTTLQTQTKHKEDPMADDDWNKTMNRRAYMDDMWAIRERS